jgi:hypothetical protein
VVYGDQVLQQVMRWHLETKSSPVEEPDLHIPPQPSLEHQFMIYETIKDIEPDMQVWGCFNGGDWHQTMNVKAYDAIMTDSYPYQAENGPVPGTEAASRGDISLPWWQINPWIKNSKIPMMKKVLPKNMPLIIIQQGMYNTSEGHVLPNVEEEWQVYHEEFNTNSFAIYPHGEGQGMGGVYVMTDERPKRYSIKNQCREFMKKLDRR